MRGARLLVVAAGRPVGPARCIVRPVAISGPQSIPGVTLGEAYRFEAGGDDCRVEGVVFKVTPARAGWEARIEGTSIAIRAGTRREAVEQAIADAARTNETSGDRRHTLTYVTIGARDMSALRAFYRSWGWSEREGASDSFTAYDAGSVRLALYPLTELTEEAAPGETAPVAKWKGITLALNLKDRSDVDVEFDRAVDAGATKVACPVERDWGGYSGYVADPEDNRWEIAWAPE